MQDFDVPCHLQHQQIALTCQSRNSKCHMLLLSAVQKLQRSASENALWTCSAWVTFYVWPAAVTTGNVVLIDAAQNASGGCCMTWWRPGWYGTSGGDVSASWVPGCCAAEFELRELFFAVPAGDLVLVDVAQEARLRFLPDFVAPWVVWNHIVLRLGESRDGRWATLTFHLSMLFTPL